MNNFTKNDLSGNLVKLDYQALLQTALFAVAHIGNELDRERDKCRRGEGVSLYLSAGRIAELGKQYAIACDTYVALKEGLEREEKELINTATPEVLK